MKIFSKVLSLLFFLTAIVCQAQTPNGKYIILSEQNPLAISAIPAALTTLSAAPVDGMVVAANSVTHPTYGASAFANFDWSGTAFPFSAFATDLATYQGITFPAGWRNFLRFSFSTSSALDEPPLDWFSPSISAPINNCRMAARFAAQAGLSGIWWDLEPNNSVAGRKLLKYSDRPDTTHYSLARYKEQVTDVIRQCVTAMAEEDPTMELLFTFGTEQAHKQDGTAEVDRDYGLLPALFKGVLKANRASMQIHNLYEDGYSHYTVAQFQADRLVKFPQAHFIPGNSTFLDYDSASTFDLVTYSNNYYTPSRLRSGLEIALMEGTDLYQEIWMEDVKISAGTVPLAYRHAIREARLLLNRIDSLFFHFNPDAFGLADGATITTGLGNLGTTYTAVAGSGNVTYDNDGISSTCGAIVLTGPNSQYVKGDADAALLATYPSQDFGYTVFLLEKVASATPGSTQTFLSFGRSATTNSLITLRTSSVGRIESQRQDDTGSSTIIGSSNAASLDTAANIYVLRSDGKSAELIKNGVRVGVSEAQDKGNQTLNQLTFGANRGNTVANYLTGRIGQVIGYSRRLGDSEVNYVDSVLSSQCGISVGAL